MTKTKICIAQTKVSNSFNINIRNAGLFIKKASRQGCQIICFPEIFLTGPLNKKNYSHSTVKKSKALFKKYCRESSIFCVMGSIIEKRSHKYYNTSYLIDDKGDIAGSYDKIHLVMKSEAKHLTAGNKTPVFRTKIGSIGIQICRDLLYPEITRGLMLNNAEIIFCPSFWCSKSSGYDYIYNHKYFKNKMPREVDSLASARAIESHVVFAYANAAGSCSSHNKYGTLLGRSQIALPFYGTTKIMENNKEGMLAMDVELDIVRDAKMVYKIEKDIKQRSHY